MEEKFDKYLPIGTVLMLKGGKKRVMITGFCSVAEENKEKTYDYSGCLYPEGYLSANQVCLFDHEQIDKIYHLGLIDEEEKAFKVKLESFMKNLDTNINPLNFSQSQEEKVNANVEELKQQDKTEEIDINANLNKNNITDLNLEEDNESNDDDDFFII